jgi:hypothetical protein
MVRLSFLSHRSHFAPYAEQMKLCLFCLWLLRVNQMNILREVVRILDIEPIHINGGEDFRFRLEIVKEVNTKNYKGIVYRLETYRLQPTFPQKKGGIPDWQHDAEIYVVDDYFASKNICGDSEQSVIDLFQKFLYDVFEDNST